MVPLGSENPYWDNYEFSDAQGAVDQLYVESITGRSYQVLDGSYAGLSGWRGLYRVLANAKPLTGIYPAGAGVQQDVALDTIPAFQFAIFYNGQLEFTWCAPLVVRGRVHANGTICLGPPKSSSIDFLGTVTTTTSIIHSNLGGYLVSGMTGPVDYDGTPTYTEKVPTLSLPIGTNNTAAAVHEIINYPPDGESASSMLGQQRYHNKASVVLLVSNTTITVTVKNQGAVTGASTTLDYSSTTPTVAQQSNLVQSLPFLSLTNKFQDYRENKWVTATQLDMNKLGNWLKTNSQVQATYPVGSGTYPNILYVADYRTLAKMHVVRLANGQTIPMNGPNPAAATGFTVATPNPIYVWGDYNVPNSAHVGTTNTSATYPASIVADALTVLSPNWKDATYGSTYSLHQRNATDMTINAAIIAGAVYSTGTASGQWSGGVHNLPRLLENWSGDTLTLNTSLVNLYNSTWATTQFQNPGIYYNAPNRKFNFDQNFLVLRKLPPGTPCVSVISRYRWTTTPLNTVTFNAP